MTSQKEVLIRGYIAAILVGLAYVYGSNYLAYAGLGAVPRHGTTFVVSFGLIALLSIVTVGPKFIPKIEDFNWKIGVIFFSLVAAFAANLWIVSTFGSVNPGAALLTLATGTALSAGLLSIVCTVKITKEEKILSLIHI